MSSAPDTLLPHPRAFVYVSAEDIFRPFIPARYIESKREAELGIERTILADPAFRGVLVRPSTPPIALLFCSLISLLWECRPHIPPTLPPADVPRSCASGPFRESTRQGPTSSPNAVRRPPHARRSLVPVDTRVARLTVSAGLGRERADHPAYSRGPRRGSDLYRGRQCPGGRKRRGGCAGDAQTHWLDAEGPTRCGKPEPCFFVAALICLTYNLRLIFFPRKYKTTGHSGIAFVTSVRALSKQGTSCVSSQSRCTCVKR